MKNKISLTNIVVCATVGAPSMVGGYRGYQAYVKKEVTNDFCIHCVIHRQHHAAKNYNQSHHTSLNILICVINKIKANANMIEYFISFYYENDEQFVMLLLHTEVRWFSKGECLIRLIELYESVAKFLVQQKEIDLSLRLKLINTDAIYSAGILKKCNECNL